MTPEHVSVPVEPSEEMKICGVARNQELLLTDGLMTDRTRVAEIYKAMIEAAPRPGDGLERELATEYAICAIESEALEDGEWLDIRPDTNYPTDLSREIRYLEQRGMLVYHPDREGVVRIKERE